VKSSSIIASAAPAGLAKSVPGLLKPFAKRAACFDMVTYDRLRVLTTEIRRLASEGCLVEIRVNNHGVLRGERLTRLLEML
jgi:hypothetical protein